MASPFDSQYAAIRSRIIHYADMYGIDRNIAIWQIWTESRFSPRVCSGKGACGIAQFIPTTAARFGVDRNDIESSLNGWGKYMSWLLRQSYIAGRIDLALAGYNAGEGSIQKYKGIPPFTETKNYVATILRNAGSASPLGKSTVANLPPSIGGIAGSLGTVGLVALGVVAFILITDE